MQLKCKVCGQMAQTDRRVRAGLADIAYDEIIQWSDFDDHPPSLKETHWTRSSTLPKMGERRLVWVEFPFSFETGEQFNALFMPAMSFFNGWEDYPEDIERSAVVFCRFERIADKDEYSAWIWVEVLKVTMLSELHRVYPAVPSGEALEAFDFSAKIHHFDYGSWACYSFNIQGDLGEWKLIFTDDTGIRHLVLMGVWDFHTHLVYCGNIVNKVAETNMIIKEDKYGKKD